MTYNNKLRAMQWAISHYLLTFYHKNISKNFINGKLSILRIFQILFGSDKSLMRRNLVASKSVSAVFSQSFLEL